MEDLTERNPMELGKVELSTCCHPKPDGIELRDWFAGVTLQGIHASCTEGYPEPAVAAQKAYEQADAMMKARGKSGQ